MHRSYLPTLAACLALLTTTALEAQTPRRTIPSGYLTSEGSSSHHPVWYYTNARAMYNYSSGATKFAGPTVIRGLRTRGNGTSRTGVAWKGDFEIKLSSVNIGKTRNLTSYDANHGSDKTLFMKRKTLDVKGWSTVKSPREWGLDFRGDRIFVAKGRELAVDVSAWTPTTQRHNNYQDAVFSSSTGDRGSVTYSGRGCPTTFYNYSVGHYVGNEFVGGWYSYAYSRSPGDVHFAFLGFNTMNTTIGKFGTTNCSLYTAPIVLTAPKVTTQTTGYAYFTLGDYAFMQNSKLGGVKVRIQHAAIDATAKTPKTSRVAEVRIGTGKSGSYYTVYGYAAGTRKYDPAKDKPTYSATTGVIFGQY